MNNKTSEKELHEKQNWDLTRKVEHTKKRIKEFYDYYEGNVYIAFSGGKDSTVLLHIARMMYPDIKAVFNNTTNERPEILEFVRSFENVEWLKPEQSFIDFLGSDGFPVISKTVSKSVRIVQHPTGNNDATIHFYMTGIRKNGEQSNGSPFVIPAKYKFFVEENIPLTEKCCDILKKNPAKKYEKKTGSKPIVGTRADESRLRLKSYVRTGCNNYSSGKGAPLSIWTDEDIDEYIKINDITLCDLYYDKDIEITENVYMLLRDENRKRKCNSFVLSEQNGHFFVKRYALDRTGCSFCGFGIIQELKNNDMFSRLDSLAISRPNMYIKYMTREGPVDRWTFCKIYERLGIHFIKPENLKAALDGKYIPQTDIHEMF